MKENVQTSSQKTFKTSHFLLVVVVVILGCVIRNFSNESSKSSQNSKISTAPKYWGICTKPWNKNGNLRTMDRVFHRLGFDFVDGTKNDEWDVLWSISYPYHSDTKIVFDKLLVKNLKPHQRINHIPGISSIARKDSLAMLNEDLEFILPLFEFPKMIETFKLYVKNNPDKKFVEKNTVNRGVKIVNVQDINYDKSSKIYQEFMDKPFLIDGRGFDLGVFVLISSIDPLRVYRYETEVLLRFCPEPYHPFNASNMDQYVIQDSYVPYSEMPSMKKYYESGFSSKLAFEMYLKNKGFDDDVELLWDEINDAISTIIQREEETFIKRVCIKRTAVGCLH